MPGWVSRHRAGSFLRCSGRWIGAGVEHDLHEFHGQRSGPRIDGSHQPKHRGLSGVVGDIDVSAVLQQCLQNVRALSRVPLASIRFTARSEA